MSKYTRFIVMILASTLVMYGLMYLNTYALEHVYFSETRACMALYMGAAMAVVMLVFMLGMYTDKFKNVLILGGSAVLFAIGIWCARKSPSVIRRGSAP